MRDMTAVRVDLTEWNSKRSVRLAVNLAADVEPLLSRMEEVERDRDRAVALMTQEFDENSKLRARVRELEADVEHLGDKFGEAEAAIQSLLNSLDRRNAVSPGGDVA